jgi:DNA polymerase I-like protein with 3'-5' exonuclease and polymerase domains
LESGSKGYYVIIGADLEWGPNGKIGVVGLAYDNGLKMSAAFRNDQTFKQYLEVLGKADTVVGHSFLDADCPQLASEGVDISVLEPKVFDTRLAMHSVNGHLAGTGSFDLRSVVLLLNGRHGQRFPLDWKKYRDDILGTCAADAAASLWCYPTLDRLIKSRHLEGIVKTAHAVQPIFTRMREQGVRLDTAVLNRIHAERKEKQIRLVDEYGLWEERGKKVIRKVPLWRSKKVLDIFEQRFGIRPKNTQRMTWVKLAADNRTPQGAKELAEAIIDLSKGANDAHWLGTAVETEDGIDFEKVSKDGFIFPRYDLCGSPDRATTSSPSIQNWPRVSDDPRKIPIRSAIIPFHEGQVVLGLDFSSIETLTNAIESNDWDRVRAVQEKRLSHEGTAELINTTFGLSLNRNQGKVVNHAGDKGESPWNLACRLFNTERPSRQQTTQCRAIFERMLAEYPKTAQFRDKLWERSIENPLTVTNSFGRQLMCFSRSKYGDADERYAKHVPEKKYWCTCAACAPRRDRWKYAIAFLGRSAAFDILLTKMARIWYDKRLDEYSLPFLEVHDELDFSVPVEKAECYAQIAKECFEEPVAELGGVSFPAEYKIGKNWAEAH